MGLLKKTKIINVLVSLLMIAIGVLIVLYPSLSMKALCYVLGAAAIVFGAIKVVNYFQKTFARFIFQFDLGLGAFLIALGVMLIALPEKISAIIPVVIGVFWFIEGAMRFETYADARKCGLKYRSAILAFAVIFCVLGLLLIINPFKGANALMILLGVSIIIDGIQNVLIIVYLSKFGKKIRSEERVVKLDDETEIHF